MKYSKIKSNNFLKNENGLPPDRYFISSPETTCCTSLVIGGIFYWRDR